MAAPRQAPTYRVLMKVSIVTTISEQLADLQALAISEVCYRRSLVAFQLAIAGAVTFWLLSINPSLDIPLDGRAIGIAAYIVAFAATWLVGLVVKAGDWIRYRWFLSYRYYGKNADQNAPGMVLYR